MVPHNAAPLRRVRRPYVACRSNCDGAGSVSLACTFVCIPCVATRSGA